MTKMWKEIQDQVPVSKIILDKYLPKAEYYHELLKKKNGVVLFGTGASLFACKMSRYSFYKYAKINPLVLAAADANYVLDNIDKNALIIIVSQSGESKETVDICRMLKARGLSFWGITNNEDSYLAKQADEALFLFCDEEVSSATKTNMAQLLLFYIISAGHCAKESLEKLPAIIEASLNVSNKEISKFSAKLKDAKNLYILGIGVNGETAVQGNLLVKEKTFIHSSGMGIVDFRHGEVEVIEPGLPIVLIAFGDKAVKEALIHGEFFKELGVDLYLICDRKPSKEIVDGDHIIVIESPDEEVFTHICALMPLQLLAESIARINGYDVDGFRYLSKVVATY